MGLLVSALTGALVAFFLNAAFQTRRDIRLSVDTLYSTAERYRSATQTRLHLLHSYCFLGKPDSFAEQWNSMREEICDSGDKIKVMIATEFPSLSMHQRELLSISNDLGPLIAKVHKNQLIQKDDVTSLFNRLDAEIDGIQSSLIEARTPSWKYVIKRLLGLD